MESENEKNNESSNDKLKRLVTERDAQISGLTLEEQEQYIKLHKDFTDNASNGTFSSKPDEAEQPHPDKEQDNSANKE